jgi:hypothetical protein
MELAAWPDSRQLLSRANRRWLRTSPANGRVEFATADGTQRAINFGYVPDQVPNRRPVACFQTFKYDSIGSGPLEEVQRLRADCKHRQGEFTWKRCWRCP